MSLAEVIFFGFMAIAAVSALGIVFTKNVLHAAMLLVSVLISLAAIFVLFQAEFVAVVQILVYAGGIVVLLAFGIMLTNRDKSGHPFSNSQLVLPSTILIAFILAFLPKIIGQIQFVDKPDMDVANEIPAFGIGFMTEHLLAFELIAFILLVVLVGASFIAKKQTEL